MTPSYRSLGKLRLLIQYCYQNTWMYIMTLDGIKSSINAHYNNKSKIGFSRCQIYRNGPWWSHQRLFWMTFSLYSLWISFLVWIYYTFHESGTRILLVYFVSVISHVSASSIAYSILVIENDDRARVWVLLFECIVV